MAQPTQESDRKLELALAAYLAAQEHRGGQSRIRANYLREFLDLWPILAKASTSTDVSRWLRLNVALVHRWRKPSQALGVEFYRAQRLAQMDGVKTTPTLPRMPDEQIVRNLLDRGPGVLRRARLVGADDVQAEADAAAAAGASGARMVLDGGRSAQEALGRLERTEIGFMRVTDGDPCEFCAMVVSRGAVYQSEATAGADANERFVGEGLHKYHDKCGCTVVPIFSRTEFLSPEADKYLKIWNDSTKGLTGSDARRAFRAALEGREFTGAKLDGSTAERRLGGGSASQPLGFDNLTREQLEHHIEVLSGLPDTQYKADTLAKYRARLAAL